MLSLKWFKSVTIPDCSVWWGIFNILQTKSQYFFFPVRHPASQCRYKKKCLHTIICWTSLEIVSVPLRMLLLTLWDWSSCNMELSEFKKYFRMNFKKYFNNRKYLGVFWLEVVTWLMWLNWYQWKERREMALPLQYLSVVQSSISLNPIKLLMEVKILEKCPSYVQSEAGCVTQK